MQPAEDAETAATSDAPRELPLAVVSETTDTAVATATKSEPTVVIDENDPLAELKRKQEQRRQELEEMQRKRDEAKLERERMRAQRAAEREERRKQREEELASVVTSKEDLEKKKEEERQKIIEQVRESRKSSVWNIYGGVLLVSF